MLASREIAMANAVPRRSDETELRATVRRALHDLLPAIHEVEAAYVELDGPHATVRAVVSQANLALTERLTEISEQLDARAPGLSFGVLPLEHQGRGIDSMGWLGAVPDYIRA